MGEKRYWLRGGIISLIILFIIGIIILFLLPYVIHNYGSYCPGNSNCITTPIGKIFYKIDNILKFIALYPIDKLLVGTHGIDWFGVILIISLAISRAIIMGAIIGWIYGKIKNRGENNYNEGGMK